MKHLLIVFIGGGIGSVLRYGIAYFLNSPKIAFPYGTFIANILGCLIVGLLMGLATKNNMLSQAQTVFLVTGFCGGFTTFSSFAFENVVFLKNGDILSLALYAGASFVFGLLFVCLGLFLVNAA